MLPFSGLSGFEDTDTFGVYLLIPCGLKVGFGKSKLTFVRFVNNINNQLNFEELAFPGRVTFCWGCSQTLSF